MAFLKIEREILTDGFPSNRSKSLLNLAHRIFYHSSFLCFRVLAIGEQKQTRQTCGWMFCSAKMLNNKNKMTDREWKKCKIELIRFLIEKQETDS